MEETEKTIADWIEQTFPGAEPAGPRRAVRVLEEMVELCLAAGASQLQIMAAVEGHLRQGAIRGQAEVAKETADVYITLCGLARSWGFEIAVAVDEKMKINRARKWRAFGDGTGYHIKGVES